MVAPKLTAIKETYFQLPSSVFMFLILVIRKKEAK